MHYASIDELLRDLPRLAEEHRADLTGRNACFLFTFKQGRRVYLTLSDGHVSLAESSAAVPDATVIADENDLLAMLAGQLNPMKAIMFGKVKIQGNPKPLLDMIALLK